MAPARPPRPETLGEFEQSLLLAIVHLGDGAYGVPVRREIERRTGHDVALGAIYTSLARLERKGLVTSCFSDPLPERGGRARRYFMLRPTGAQALRESRRRLSAMWQGLEPDLRRTRS